MSTGDVLASMVVMSMFPMGLKCISQEGMILGRFGTWMDKWTETMPEQVRKPLWTCPRCMSLWYGVPMACLILFAPWWGQALPLIVTAIGIQDTLDK